MPEEESTPWAEPHTSPVWPPRWAASVPPATGQPLSVFARLKLARGPDWALTSGQCQPLMERDLITGTSSGAACEFQETPQCLCS